MVVRAGAFVDATDFALPGDAVAAAGGAGTNTISATTWAVLPTNPVSASISNPHPSLSLLVDCYYGGWLIGAGVSSGGVRAGIDISGSVAISPGVGAGAAVGWGEILFNQTSQPVQCHSMITVELPVSTTAAVFAMHAYRDASGSGWQVNYPTIRLVPRRFVEA